MFKLVEYSHLNMLIRNVFWEKHLLLPTFPTELTFTIILSFHVSIPLIFMKSATCKDLQLSIPQQFLKL